MQLPLSSELIGPRPLSSQALPLPGQPGAEARVIRVSIDNDHGNLYRSILVRPSGLGVLLSGIERYWGPGQIHSLSASLPSSPARIRRPVWFREPWRSTTSPSRSPATTSCFRSFQGTRVSKCQGWAEKAQRATTQLGTVGFSRA